jgi:hypothetical protein
MKKVEYNRMSRRGTGGMPGLSTALLTGRGSTPMRPRGSHSSPGKGSGLVLSLESHGTGEGPTGLH